MTNNDSFLLDKEELARTQRKNSPKNQLIFAVMLKFFQIEGRYPNQEDLLSPLMVSSLVEQLDLPAIEFSEVHWQGRSTERFRQEIRQFLGYQPSTVVDSKKLISWLIENVMPNAPTLPQCYEKSYQFFRDHALEPFTPKKLDRYIRSATYNFEKLLFLNVFTQLSSDTKKSMEDLLKDDSIDMDQDDQVKPLLDIMLRHLKKDIAGRKLKHVNFEIDKLNRLRMLKIPTSIFGNVSRKVIKKYYTRILAELPSNIKYHSPEIRYTTMAAFCSIRSQFLTDNLADFFIHLVHKMKTSSEIAINKDIISEVKPINGKFDILYLLADAAAANPAGIIQEKIYPKVSQETLKDLVKELQYKGKWYQTKVQTKMRSLYIHAHRPVLLNLLNVFSFQTNSSRGQALLGAIAFIKKNQKIVDEYYPDSQDAPISGAVSSTWHSIVVKEQNLSLNPENSSQERPIKISRINYEMAILEELYKQLRCKSVWIEGAYRYRNPDEDLPRDFDSRRKNYYQMLDLSLDPDEFIKTLKESLAQHLQQLNEHIVNNKKVKIIEKKDGSGRIKVSPSGPQAEPLNLKTLQRAITRRWSTVNLLDILKESDLRIGFTGHFHTVASRKNIDRKILHKRLLLCLYAIGSNTGLKRVSGANADAEYSDLRYIKRRFIHVANVRAAIAEVVNEILAIRDPRIWGTATTGCACDSTKISCWDQNLITEWHVRYHGRGVMIYWHVDTNAACIYSQLKTCSSSEVGAMIKGMLDHCTEMDMRQGYVDTHGQSTIGFAFSYLLHFDLLPRLKNINKQKLHYPTAKHKEDYPNLTPILKSSINWNLIRENYDEVVKHVAALKTGTVEPDVLIKRFSKDNYDHPVYKSLTEIGDAVKTIFLCRYLSSEDLRIEIHSALNVVERLNSVMGFIFYGKLGEISTNNKEDQELAVVCLHLLQVCMVYINTLIIQDILSDPAWENKLTAEDMRALTPLIHAHINPYGLFPLDMNQRLVIIIPKTSKRQAI